MATVIYAVLIIASAWVTSFLGSRGAQRVLKELDLPRSHAQLAVTLPMIAFLVVVSLPAGVVLAAMVLMIDGVRSPDAASRPLRKTWPWLLAILLFGLGLTESPGTWPPALPGWALPVIAAGAVVPLLMAAHRLPAPTLRRQCLLLLVACLPLMAAPVLFKTAHASLMIDTAIMCAAVCAGALVLPATMPVAALLRLPVTLLFFHAVVQALHYGAWPMAGLALVLWVGGMFMTGRPHAHLMERRV